MTTDPRVKRTSAFVPHDLAEAIIGSGVGPLAGCTFAVKDMFDVRGERCSAGHPDWLASATPATENAPIIDVLRAAGATLIGKTICDELFYSLTGVNIHYGTPENPAWPARLPGGSSSGSASAVASGSCDFALGSDTGGSVRIPAAFCGVFGIRATIGLVNSRGAMSMAPSFDSLGWFARSADVLGRVGSVLLPEESADPRETTRVLVPLDALEFVKPEVTEVFKCFTDVVAGHLTPIESVEIYGGKADMWVECFREVQAGEIGAIYGPWLRSAPHRFAPDVTERLEHAVAIAPESYLRARRERAHIRDVVRRIIGPGTVLLLPTTPCPPPPLGADAEDLQVFRANTMRLTCIAGIGGLPQVTMPVAGPNGPLSVSLLGPPRTDRHLLGLTRAFASALVAQANEPGHA